MAEPKSTDITEKQLGDQLWRLNNLYWITDKDAKKVRFRLNWAQRAMFEQLWFWNLVLKARQLGVTTFWHILFLDTCLFNSNIRAGCIAHDLESVKELFERNIKFAYDNLPESIKSTRPAKRDAANQLSFSNGSSIRVATSFRSGTQQLLHVSEFGKICAKYPRRAKEIVTGSFEAVGKGNIVAVESTAEGREGYFWEYSEAAKALADAKKRLTDQDWKFFFFPWWRHPDYRSRDVQGTVITSERRKYFDELEAELGIQIPLSRRVWYVKKASVLGDDMFREYPSTPAEAFFISVRGAYYKQQLVDARKEGRIDKIPPVDGRPVETWWDIGVDDSTAIWFVQEVGRELRVVDYYEQSGEGVKHFAQVLADKAEKRGFVYSHHFAPHDIEVREWGNNATGRRKSAEAYGIKFFVVKNHDLDDGIEEVRNALPTVVFDEEHCDDGIKCLENYRKIWDEARGCYLSTPYHDWTSHGADAFRTGIMGRLQIRAHTAVAPRQERPSARGWT